MSGLWELVFLAFHSRPVYLCPQAALLYFSLSLSLSWIHTEKRMHKTRAVASDRAKRRHTGYNAPQKPNPAGKENGRCSLLAHWPGDWPGFSPANAAIHVPPENRHHTTAAPLPCAEQQPPSASTLAGVGRGSRTRACVLVAFAEKSHFVAERNLSNEILLKLDVHLVCPIMCCAKS